MRIPLYLRVVVGVVLAFRDRAIVGGLTTADLGAVGLPEKAVATLIPLVFSVDWILARCRSAVNVMSDMLVAILLDRWRGAR